MRSVDISANVVENEIVDDARLDTGEGNIVTKRQATALRAMWAERAEQPCPHQQLELVHDNDHYLTDNYHCTACGELVAANTRDPFQVI